MPGENATLVNKVAKSMKSFYCFLNDFLEALVVKKVSEHLYAGWGGLL